MTELTCPICGGSVVIAEDVLPEMYRAICSRCNLKSDYFPTRQMLIDYWTQNVVHCKDCVWFTFNPGTQHMVCTNTRVRFAEREPQESCSEGKRWER